MRDHPVDLLLRLAFLEGAVHTRGAYERAVLRRRAEEMIPAARAQRLEERLAGALVPGGADDLLTAGSFLISLRRRRSLRIASITRHLGLTGNIYRMLERDRISPLKIAPEVWKSIGLLGDLTAGMLEEMIRRTHGLVYFRPSYRATLARYRRSSTPGTRAGAVEQAARELYARALLPLPPAEEERMREFLRSVLRAGTSAGKR